jgi:hypothetical protein
MTVFSTGWRRTVAAWAVVAATAGLAQAGAPKAGPEGVSTNRIVFRRQARRPYTRPLEVVKPEVAIRLPSDRPDRRDAPEPGVETAVMTPGANAAGVAAYLNQVRAANARREREQSATEQEDWLLPRSPLMDLGLAVAPPPEESSARASWGWLADGVERLSQHDAEEEGDAAGRRDDASETEEWIAAYFPSLSLSGDRGDPRAAAAQGFALRMGDPAGDPDHAMRGEGSTDAIAAEARSAWTGVEADAAEAERFVGTMDAAQIRAELDAGRLGAYGELSTIPRVEMERSWRSSVTTTGAASVVGGGVDSAARLRPDDLAPGLRRDAGWGGGAMQDGRTDWTRGSDAQGRGFWAGEAPRDRWTPTTSPAISGADRAWAAPSPGADILRSSQPLFSMPPAPTRTEDPAPWLRPTRPADAPNYLDPMSPRR